MFRDSEKPKKSLFTTGFGITAQKRNNASIIILLVLFGRCESYLIALMNQSGLAVSSLCMQQEEKPVWTITERHKGSRIYAFKEFITQTRTPGAKVQPEDGSSCREERTIPFGALSDPLGTRTHRYAQLITHALTGTGSIQQKMNTLHIHTPIKCARNP